MKTLIFFFFFSVISQDCSALDKTKAFLLLKVVDSSTNEPRGNVGIKFDGMPGGYNFRAITDSMGIAKIPLDDIPTDTFRIGFFQYKYPDKEIFLKKSQLSGDLIVVYIDFIAGYNEFQIKFRKDIRRRKRKSRRRL